jgi:DNA-binding transcriptional ArsR family regulator
MQPEPTGSFEPAPQFTITSLETLKVFSDPLRQQIIEALLDGAKTVKQIASELDIAPTKLYYHVNLLEEHKLIQVTDTRIVSGIIEKHYQASARRFSIERSLLTPGEVNGVVDAALDAMLDPIRAEIHRGLNSGLIDNSDDAPLTRKLKIWREPSRLSLDQAEAFYNRLEALVQEFGMHLHEPENADCQPYTLIISIYPTQTPSQPTRSPDE